MSKECTFCGNTVDDDEEYCPHCGTDFDDEDDEFIY